MQSPAQLKEQRSERETAGWRRPLKARDGSVQASQGGTFAAQSQVLAWYAASKKGSRERLQIDCKGIQPNCKNAKWNATRGGACLVRGVEEGQQGAAAHCVQDALPLLRRGVHACTKMNMADQLGWHDRELPPSAP